MTLKDDDILIPVVCWFIFYVPTIWCAIQHQRNEYHASFQILLTDIWTIMALMLPSFYIVIKPLVREDKYGFHIPCGGLLIASQCVGAFFAFMSISRSNPRERESRLWRASILFVDIFLGAIGYFVTLFFANGVRKQDVIVIAFTLLAGFLFFRRHYKN